MLPQQHNPSVKNNAAVAVLKKTTHEDSIPGGTLACALPWGHGWGWATLPNGVWSGGRCIFLVFFFCVKTLTNSVEKFIQIADGFFFIEF